MPLTHGTTGTEILRCETDNKHRYTVTHIPDGFFEDVQLVSGSVRISVLDSCVYGTGNGYMRLDEGEGVIVDGNVANGLTMKKESRNIIVMRVFDSRGSGPTLSKAVFADKIFGVDGDGYNLVSGFGQCSGNKMIFTPGIYSKVATNGVMDLNLSVDTNGMTDGEIESLATKAANNLPNFNYDSYDHIMFILKPNIEGLVAQAELNGRVSVFSDKYATMPSTLIHELGHNLGHLHSGMGSDQYGDESCTMGYGDDDDEGPVMCFNAAKSWYTNWYSKRHANLIPRNTNGGADLSLVGINDFVNDQSTSAHTTIVRINGGKELLFMMYNKKEGVNSGVLAFGDKVTIVTQGSKNNKSWTRAQLSVNQEYTVNNFGGGGGRLVVKVCSMVAGSPDVARTLVYVTNVQTLSCGSNPVASPVNSPVNSPVGNPVTPPSTVPVTAPTNPPITSPVGVPTSRPTPLVLSVIPTPSESSELPTPQSSDEYYSTPEPTPEQTPEQTPEPTYYPTPDPTPEPTPEPTRTQNCANKEQLLTVEIKTDWKSGETNFNIRQRNTRKQFKEIILKKNRFTKNAINLSYVCVNKKTGCYKLLVKDKGRNGIKNGYIKLYYNDKQFYKKIFRKGKQIQKKFGRGCKN